MPLPADARRRFILIVLDGCGAGRLPDADTFGEPPTPVANTLGNTSRAVGGFSLPHLQRLGFGNITPMQGVAPAHDAPSLSGRLVEISRGKDTVTGHWEMMGVHTRVAFPTYPDGFPPDVLATFAEICGKPALGNRAASGTEIIRELGLEHVRTGCPIVYTSADSVFQVAAHEDPVIFGLDRLLDVCARMREKLVPPNHVGRVIARPFVGTSPENFTRTENRKDFPLPPPIPTTLDKLTQAGKTVHAIGVIGEVFSGRGITTSERTRSNPEHLDALYRAVADWNHDGADFIFANLEDFDMLYGHRNDSAGFARLLTDFDTFVGDTLLPALKPGDLVGITSDHGNDPTTPSTDHSREYAPCLLFGPPVQRRGIGGYRLTFADWGATVADWLGVSAAAPDFGTSLLTQQSQLQKVLPNIAYSAPMQQVLDQAKQEAHRLGESYASTEHLLLGITHVPTCAGAEYLVRSGIPLAQMQEMIDRQRAFGGPVGDDIQMTPRAQRILQIARDTSVQAGCATVGTHHLLAALLLEGEGLAARVLEKIGFDAATVKAAVVEATCE